MFKKLFGKKSNEVTTIAKAKGFKITWDDYISSDKNGYDIVKTYEQAEKKKAYLLKNDHIFNIKIDPIY